MCNRRLWGQILTLYLLSWIKASITPYSIYSNQHGPLMWHYYYHYYYFLPAKGWKSQTTVWKITTKQPQCELYQTNITKYNNNNNQAMYRAAKTIWYRFFSPGEQKVAVWQRTKLRFTPTGELLTEQTEVWAKEGKQAKLEDLLHFNLDACN